MRRLLGSVAISIAAVSAVVGAVAAPSTVAADGPGSGTPWVVSLGDSYISGEAGRWAGNSNQSPSLVDTGGAAVYYDDGGVRETIPGCHRSRSAEIHIGGGVNSLNLACSGARTTSYTSGDSFKPGIDFYESGTRKGQALMLQEFAAVQNVEMVVVSIGGNDFQFADIVQRCVTNWLTSPSWWKNYCNDDSDIRSIFSSSNVASKTAAIGTALGNVRTAMARAGYGPSDYTLVVQNYPSPIPRGSGFRYSQSGWSRQNTGGCGFWNRDADWANDTALTTINGAVASAASSAGATLLDLSGALVGRRLCETGVDLVEKVVTSGWTTAGASDRSEWVAQIRTITTVFGPYEIQESIHPNYWGQMAIRNCIRQAWAGGAVRGGTCTRGVNGLTPSGEPNMTLT